MHYANDYTVALPPLRLPATVKPTQLELEAALVQLRAAREDKLWKWSDVVPHLPDPGRAEAAHIFFIRNVASDLTVGWPTYARVKRNAYRFLAEGEDIPAPSSCEQDILGVVRDILVPAGRTPFSWRDVWSEMEVRGTLYEQQAVRTTVTQHMVNALRAEGRAEPALRRVGRGMFELVTAAPTEVLATEPSNPSTPTMVRLECAWCGRVFKRELRQVHPGPSYCSRSHQAQAVWASTHPRRVETTRRVEEHGTYPSYRRGCRCDECRAANTERIRRYRAKPK